MELFTNPLGAAAFCVSMLAWIATFGYIIYSRRAARKRPSAYSRPGSAANLHDLAVIALCAAIGMAGVALWRASLGDIASAVTISLSVGIVAVFGVAAWRAAGGKRK